MEEGGSGEWAPGVTAFLATVLVFDDHMRLKERFHWLVPQTVVTEGAGRCYTMQS